ncbi:hypothetical protein [Mycolicibacterium sp. A43C]
MSNTSVMPTNREWFRRLLSGHPHQVIGGSDRPYLRRWYVIPRNPVLNVYVHQFLRSDDDRALHDHPWWFVSVILKGAYVEVSEQPEQKRKTTYRCAPEYRDSPGLDHMIKLPRRMFAFRPATFRHRVALFNESEWSDREVPCWTLIVTGRRVRTWGFWCRRLIDVWSAETNEEMDAIAASDTGQIEADRFVPWPEFGDAGCGES